MKKVLSLGMAVVLTLSLTACGGRTESKETTATQAQGQTESAQSGKETTQAASNVELVATRWSGGQSDDQKELVKGYTASEIVIDDVAYDKLKEKETLSMQKSGGGDYDLIYCEIPPNDVALAAASYAKQKRNSICAGCQ